MSDGHTDVIPGLEAYLRTIVQGLVRHPKVVSVTSHEVAGTVYLQIGVDAAEAGLVVGKGGATFQALKELVKCAGLTRGRKVFLEAHIHAVQPPDTPKPPQCKAEALRANRSIAPDGTDAHAILADYLSMSGMSVSVFGPRHVRELMEISGSEAAEVRAYVLGMFGEEMQPATRRCLQRWEA